MEFHNALQGLLSKLEQDNSQSNWTASQQPTLEAAPVGARGRRELDRGASGADASTPTAHTTICTNQTSETHAKFIGQYSSLETLLESCRSMARLDGFALATLRSDKKRNTVDLCCDRYGIHQSAAVKRQTASKKSRCTFALSAKLTRSGFWEIVKQTGAHNHELFPADAGFLGVQRLTARQKEQRLGLQVAGVEPKAQLTFLRNEYPGLSIVSRSLYNDKQEARSCFLNGRTPIQALFDELADKNFLIQYQRDAQGRLTHFLFAHPKSVELAVEFHKVLILDCTYKTNRYNMPLLNCSGLTPSHRTFLCCGVFLRREEQADYVWVLRALKDLLGGSYNPVVLVTDNEKALLNAEQVVFPDANRILCRWHINKNITKNCKKWFHDEQAWTEVMQDWNSIYLAPNEDEWRNLWEQFREKYCHLTRFCDYVDKTWLVYKEMFVEVWVSKVRHFGCTTTSRVEGLHAFLKQFISSSVGDLLTVTQELTLAIEHQINELSKIHSDDRVKRDFAARIGVFDDVVYMVSRHALSLVNQHCIKTSGNLLCRSIFLTTMGLP